jgi:hypothetical protein
MRTSGAATESRLIFAMVFVALFVCTVLAGGPKELMLTVENALRTIAATIVQIWLSWRP